MTHGIDPEEAAALAVLDSLGRLDSPEDTSVPEPEDEIDQVLRKLHGDAIAMLAYGLEPVAPRAELRAAIFSLTVGESTQEVEPLPTSPAAEVRMPSGVPSRAPSRVTAATPAAQAPHAPNLFSVVDSTPASAASPAIASGATSSSSPRERVRFAEGASSGSRERRRGRGWMGLAAALFVALVGAGFWIAYLQSELAAQETRQAWAEREWKSRSEAVRTEMKEMEKRLSLVTSPAVTIFHLRCPSGSGPGATANANVFVSSDRKRWDLQVQGLSSQPPEHQYQLWFLVGDEARSGGCFSVEDGEVVLLNPASFPTGTTGIAISVEPKGGSSRPTTAPILVSEEPVRL